MTHWNERGLVVREPNPDDRRNQIVTLTPADRELLAPAGATSGSMEADLLAEVPETDRATS